jgi:hypothetical protein
MRPAKAAVVMKVDLELVTSKPDTVDLPGRKGWESLAQLPL